jgi:hypothetical protein
VLPTARPVAIPRSLIVAFVVLLLVHTTPGTDRHQSRSRSSMSLTKLSDISLQLLNLIERPLELSMLLL